MAFLYVKAIGATLWLFCYLPALLSRFCVTLSAMSPDPPAKIKIVSFGRNYLTG
jgi:hypothetical protein